MIFPGFLVIPTGFIVFGVGLAGMSFAAMLFSPTLLPGQIFIVGMLSGLFAFISGIVAVLMVLKMAAKEKGRKEKIEPKKIRRGK